MNLWGEFYEILGKTWSSCEKTFKLWKRLKNSAESINKFYNIFIKLLV